MKQDEIIEMARQAGMELDDSFVLEEDQIWYFCKENFIAFAKLVDAKAVRREREECVNAIKGRSQAKQDEWRVTRAMIVRECIEDIRARGQA